MSREIKFRAWDNVNFRMFHFGGFCWHDEYDLCYIDGKLDVPAGDNLEWMQFTGLKDKNGKEIYEGDICRFGSGMVSPIIWKDGGLGYESYPGADYADFHGFAGHQWLKEIMTTLEVIGNIYENAELLKP